MSNNEHKLICRKCGGPHLTIKCGKCNKNETIQNENCKQNKYNKNEKTFFKSEKKYFLKTFGVKITNLPSNMTDRELMELTANWGTIVKLVVLHYEYKATSVAFINFGYEEEANYFVKALDKTPFEYEILSLIRV
jgi:hypothetical protein